MPNYFKKYTFYVFLHFIIPRYWKRESGRNSSQVKIMSADDLATQGAKALAVMLLTKFTPNNGSSSPQGLIL